MNSGALGREAMGQESQRASDAATLSSLAISGLQKVALSGGTSISDQDRVHAVRLLGQFSEEASTDALVLVLTEAKRRIYPPPLARWVRDTALDTLLRSPALPRLAVNGGLAAYYSFFRGPLRSIGRRNLVYDDIPVLAQHAKLGLLFRVYLLPLVLVLFGLILFSNLVFDLLGRMSDNIVILLLGTIFFVALGLLTFSIHQVLLVALRALFQRSPGAYSFRGSWPRLPAAFLLILVGVPLSVYTVFRMFKEAISTNPGALLELSAWTLALPLLLLPSYLLAYDLEVTRGAYRGSSLAAGLAAALRFLNGLMYVAYVTVAYGIAFRAGSFAGENGTATTWFVRVLFVVFLVVEPVLLMLLVGGAGHAKQLMKERGTATRPA